MEWFGVEVADILSAEWLALPEAPRAHWLSLHAYCALHENGGVIRGAARWRDREWSFAAGLRLRSVEKLLELGLLRRGNTVSDLLPPGLIQVSHEDYVLANYDLRGEERNKETSRNKSKAAKERWRQHAQAQASADADAMRSNARDETDETDETDDQTHVQAPLTLVPSPVAPRLDFDAIYRAYPLKKGKSRGIETCRRQIRTQADFDDLRRAVANYAAEVRGKDPQYTKHFSTFMNCWRDYVTVERPPEPVDELMEGHASGRLR